MKGIKYGYQDMKADQEKKETLAGRFKKMITPSKTKPIKDMLPDLSRKELQELRNRINYLLLSSRKDMSQSSSGSLYEAIRSEFLDVLKEKLPAYKHLAAKKSNLLPLIEDVSLFLREFLVIALGRRPRRSEMELCYRLYARLVLQRLLESKIPITSKSILNYYAAFPSILDAAFPGYLKSGLLHLVFEGQTYFNGENLEWRKNAETDKDET